LRARVTRYAFPLNQRETFRTKMAGSRGTDVSNHLSACVFQCVGKGSSRTCVTHPGLVPKIGCSLRQPARGISQLGTTPCLAGSGIHFNFACCIIRTWPRDLRWVLAYHQSAEDFPALLEMSAYHHVKDETRYPAALLTTGMNDPVVDPWQPAKMAAPLQSSTSSGKPVLLRVDNAGHDQWGATRSELYALRADQLVFMLWQVGALSSRRQ
jgi:prolyl oligopeptidase family protein